MSTTTGTGATGATPDVTKFPPEWKPGTGTTGVAVNNTGNNGKRTTTQLNPGTAVKGATPNTTYRNNGGGRKRNRKHSRKHRKTAKRSSHKRKSTRKH